MFPQVADRIAEELDVDLGGVIGVVHRGRAHVSDDTIFQVITDGISQLESSVNTPWLI